MIRPDVIVPPVAVVKNRFVVDAVVEKRLVVVAFVVVERSKNAPPATSSLELRVVVAVAPITTPTEAPPFGYIPTRFVVVPHLLFGVVMISATQVNEPADHCRWLAPVHGDSAPPKKLVA